MAFSNQLKISPNAATIIPNAVTIIPNAVTMTRNNKLSWPLQLRQLAVMIDAGLPIDTSLKSISERSGEASAKLSKAQRLVKRGVSLPDAFQRVALVNDFDYAMLTGAATAGRLADGLNHISESRVNQLQRAESFRASLILPRALIVVGGLAGIFIRTASGGQALVDAIAMVGLIMALFYLATVAAVAVVTVDTRVWFSWFWPYAIVRKRLEWYCLALEYFFYNNLIWQLSGGVAASNATRVCGLLLDSNAFRARVMAAADAMDRGESMPQALLNEGLVLTDRLRQVLLIANHSGTHEAAITHELSLQRIRLKQKTDNLFKWAPRVAYVIALVVVSKLITV